MQLHNYLNKFHLEIEKLENYGFAETLEINEEIRANKQAVVNVKVFLVNGSILQIKEYIDARYQIEHVSYAYHYQDKEGKCLFRYDNAVHKPDLKFKGHKHTKDGKIIIAPVPKISELVEEVIENL
jgi:hypothetical protein